MRSQTGLRKKKRSAASGAEMAGPIPALAAKDLASIAGPGLERRGVRAGWPRLCSGCAER